MCRSPEASEEHVAEAIRLFTVSTLDAAKSGVAAHITVTPEMRTEIQVFLCDLLTSLTVCFHFGVYTSLNFVSPELHWVKYELSDLFILLPCKTPSLNSAVFVASGGTSEATHGHW